MGLFMISCWTGFRQFMVLGDPLGSPSLAAIFFPGGLTFGGSSANQMTLVCGNEGDLVLAGDRR